MNLFDVLHSIESIANKHKLVEQYKAGDVYRIMNNAKNTYPCIVLTTDALVANTQDYSTLTGYIYFIDRLTDDEDNKYEIQANSVNVINDIFSKLGETNGIYPTLPLSYTFFTEKFADLTCGAYANFSIQFVNNENCCNNFEINKLYITENGEYQLDDVDIVNVNVQPTATGITITENGTYNPNDYGVDYFNGIDVNVEAPLKCFNAAIYQPTGGTSLASYFSGHNKITELNVDCLDTNGITNMRYMFYTCTNLVKVDVSNFNTSNVSNMQAMFRECQKLPILNLRNFDCSNVNNVELIFGNCKELVSIVGDGSYCTGNEIAPNEDIKCMKNLSISISLGDCTKLRYSSIYGIVNGLANVSATQTIAFSSSAFNNMYNDDGTIPTSSVIEDRKNTIIQIASNKNWNILLG